MMSVERYKQLDKLSKPKKHKYNAKQTIIDGIKFPSKKEADYYRKLKIQQSKGEIARFHRQVIFDLPGSIKYLCDFMIIYHDPNYHFDNVEYVDVKGYMTPVSKLKIKQCEEIYNIEIKIV